MLNVLKVPVVESQHIAGFKYTCFRGPDGMMVELHEGLSRIPKDYHGEASLEVLKNE